MWIHWMAILKSISAISLLVTQIRGDNIFIVKQQLEILQFKLNNCCRGLKHTRHILSHNWIYDMDLDPTRSSLLA